MVPLSKYQSLTVYKWDIYCGFLWWMLMFQRPIHKRGSQINLTILWPFNCIRDNAVFRYSGATFCANWRIGTQVWQSQEPIMVECSILQPWSATSECHDLTPNQPTPLLSGILMPINCACSVEIFHAHTLPNLAFVSGIILRILPVQYSLDTNHGKT